MSLDVEGGVKFKAILSNSILIARQTLQPVDNRCDLLDRVHSKRLHTYVSPVSVWINFIYKTTGFKFKMSTELTDLMNVKPLILLQVVCGKTLN